MTSGTRRGRPPRADDPAERIERVEGVVSAIVPGGQGLIRDDKGVVLARGGLPGERVEVDVRKVQRRVRHGVVVRVLEPSPHRAASADCALHPRCGGCDLLDLVPAAAADARIAIVKDALLRVGKLNPAVVQRALRPLVTPASDDEVADARRRRARFVVVRGLPTFSVPESHERVPVERCPALHPRLDEALARVPAAALPDRAGLRLAVDDAGHVSAAVEGATVTDAARLVSVGACTGAIALEGDEELGRAGDPTLYGEIAPGYGPCASDAATFTQATRFGGAAILRAVLDAASAGPRGEPGALNGAHVLELFAGAGHLTVPLLEAGAHVTAVEGALRSVRWLEHNTSRHGDRVRARRAFIDGTLAVPSPLDVVVADPPRTGIPGLAQLVDRARAPVWVMVSCDVATGARDLAIVMKKGYALERIVPIDAFPRTSHVEWVARLVRT